MSYREYRFRLGGSIVPRRQVQRFLRVMDDDHYLCDGDVIIEELNASGTETATNAESYRPNALLGFLLRTISVFPSKFHLDV